MMSSALGISFLFILVSGVVAFFGHRLSTGADELSSATGLGASVVGGFLLAMVTSIPELGTGLSAMVIADNPNLAGGGIFGSCVFNLSILALLDVLSGKTSFFKAVDTKHLKPLTLSLGLLVMGLFGFAYRSRLDDTFSVWGIEFGGGFLLIFLLYVGYVIFFGETEDEPTPAPPSDPPLRSARAAWLNFGMLSLAVVAASLALSPIADRFALTFGLSDSFVGTLFLAIVTSLPELAVTLGCLKLGLANMAMANLIGSNLFNVSILFLEDLALFQDNYLTRLASTHLFSIWAAVALTLLTLWGVRWKTSGARLGRWSVFSVLGLAIFLLSNYLVFRGNS